MQQVSYGFFCVCFIVCCVKLQAFYYEQVLRLGFKEE